MRLITFLAGAEQRLGALVDDRRIVDLAAGHLALAEAAGWAGSAAGQRLAEAQLPADPLAFIQLGEVALGYAREVAQAAESGRLPAQSAAGRPVWYDLSAVTVLPPVPRPGKIVAIGLNYSDHAAESGMAVPKNPVLFAKFATSLVADGQPVIQPPAAVSTQLDYEVELAVVVGRKAKQVAAEDAMAHVFGYSIMNDVSARDLQFEDGQWLKGKALDTFAPFGPVLVTADEIPDPHNLNLSLTLNGQVLQSSNTRHLIFGVPQLISYLSQLFTLEPGDVISTGTPPGVGFSRKPPVFLRPGDVMVATVERIGSLTNPIVAAREAGAPASK